MKANRNFKQADEAVSPVIGVILMVAITVVLAAVVFVLVQGLGGDSESAPNLSLTKAEADDRLRVVRADADADWQRFTFTTSSDNIVMGTDDGGTGYDVVGQAATSTGAPVDGTEAVAASSTAVGAGDFIEFCLNDGTATEAAAQVDVSLIDTSTNQVLGDFTFSSIGICSNL